MLRSSDLAAAALVAGSEMERPAERQLISMRQPCPARSLPPMSKSIGMNTSLPESAVDERSAGRNMPPPDLDPGMVGGDEGERDADVFAAANQVVGIVETEGKAEKRGIGCKCDSACPR